MKFCGDRLGDILTTKEGKRIILRFLVRNQSTNRHWHTLGAYDVIDGSLYTIDTPARKITILDDLPVDHVDDDNESVIWLRVSNMWLNKHPQFKTAHKMPTIKSLKSEIGD